MSRPLPPKIKRFSPSKQRRLDELLERNAAGTITAQDKGKLEALVAEAERLMVANSQELAAFAKSQSPHPPVAAVPVTVWVSPDLAER